MNEEVKNVFSKACVKYIKGPKHPVAERLFISIVDKLYDNHEVEKLMKDINEKREMYHGYLCMTRKADLN